MQHEAQKLHLDPPIIQQKALNWNGAMMHNGSGLGDKKHVTEAPEAACNKTSAQTLRNGKASSK